MFIECPECLHRYDVQKGEDTFEIVCSCGEKITVLPWLSYRQSINKPGKIECSVCKRYYDFNKYRNNSEIACGCGNLLVIKYIEEDSKSHGRREKDRMSKQLKNKLQGLMDTCRLIHSVRNLDKLLLLIVYIITEMLDAEGCSVILCDRESRELVFNYVAGPKSSELTQLRLAEGEGIVGDAIKNKMPLIVNNVENDPRFSKRVDTISKFTTHSVLCLPLIVENKCIGALEIVNKIQGAEFIEEDLFLGEAVASQIAVAIHNVQLTETALKSERLAAIGQAVASIAHCVNNMLNGLDGGFYIIKRDIGSKLGKMSKEGFEILEVSIKQLKDLIQDMLTYSKDRKPEYKFTDINELVNSVIALMEVRAREQKTLIKFNPDSELGKIEIDPKGIYRCILNLVTNAMDACKKKGGTVNINTKALDSDKLMIKVTDQGHGMDEKTLNSVFQPFFSTKGSVGTGLGLSVTRKIIQEHGGDIEADSEAGKGSTFSVYLPIKKQKKK